jgi:hypothetical protein
MGGAPTRPFIRAPQICGYQQPIVGAAHVHSGCDPAGDRS